jgi:hypothetical protein
LLKGENELLAEGRIVKEKELLKENCIRGIASKSEG